MKSANAFAEALRQYRRARGLTQAELGENAHLSERAISDLERGLKLPQRGTVRLLAGALAGCASEGDTAGWPTRSS